MNQKFLDCVMCVENKLVNIAITEDRFAQVAGPFFGGRSKASTFLPNMNYRLILVEKVKVVTWYFEFFRYSDIYKCTKGGHCQITLKTRKNCQFCRFQACEKAGMKRSWVLGKSIFKTIIQCFKYSHSSNPIFSWWRSQVKESSTDITEHGIFDNVINAFNKCLIIYFNVFILVSWRRRKNPWLYQ